MGYPMGYDDIPWAIPWDIPWDTPWDTQNVSGIWAPIK
jgi:hypothetical protein